MQFRILGPVEVRGPRGQARLGGAKPVALLTVLMLQANRTVSYDRLISAVWGEDPPVFATAALQTYVSRLRKALAGIEPGGPERIVTYKTGYLLHVEPGELDFDQFRGHVEEGRTHAAQGRLTEAIAAFDAGLELWRGAPMNGITGELEQHVVSLDEAYVAACEQHLECRLALGEHDRLMPEINQLIATHPLRERLRELAMLALYRSGRQADALAVYQETHRLLVNELGIEPGPALRDLHQRILVADPLLRTPAPQPAAPPARPVPRQLPSDVAGFTGRDSYLTQLDDLLPADGAGGPVVISAIEGIGGVGKTALALHWAHQVTSRMTDGQLYVNLRGYAPGPVMEPSDALVWFLRALGVPQEQIPVAQEEQAALYRSLVADKRILVLLDNAATADQVRPLLPGSATCLVLITSRNDLRGLVALDGARRIVLDVLPAKEAVQLLESIVGTAEDLDVLARLCGHLPLALRIAAANLVTHPDLTVGEYINRLTEGDRLTELGIENDQQAAVRVSFDLSYQALPPTTARLFRLLGLVPGPQFSVHAAAALADLTHDETVQALGALVAAHLVERCPPKRYQFHDLIRLYAAERTALEDSEEERGTALGRLFSFYMHSTTRAARLLYPESESLLDDAEPSVEPMTFDTSAQALQWVENERTSLVAAVRHANEHGPWDVAWHIAHGLRSYFYTRMNGAEWLETANLGLRAAEMSNDVRGQMAMLHNYAHAYFTLGGYQKSVDYAAQALPLSQQIGDRRSEAEIVKWSGMASWLLGELDRSVEFLTRALTLYQQVGNTFGEMNAHVGLGIAYDDMGDWDRALYHDEAALTLSRSIGNKYGEALALQNFGMVYGQLGRFAEALTRHNRSLRLYQEVGTRFQESSAHYAIAVIHRDTGRYDEAITSAQRALTLARDTSDHRTEANALNTLGTTCTQLSRFAEAIAHHDLAAAQAVRINFGRAVVEANIGLAMAYRGQGQGDQARTLAKVALRDARTSGFRWCEANALLALAEAYLGLDQRDEAVAWAEQALALHREIKHRLGEARALRTLGTALSNPDHLAAARTIFADLSDGQPDALPG
ncbi:BTAD domain-containing putative transcriptional regulator [Kibdelosporangium lantanae]